METSLEISVTPSTEPVGDERLAEILAAPGFGIHFTDHMYVAEWTPEPHHAAFPGMLSGGVIGTLLDCHSNWTAAWTLMRAAGAERPPCTVTAEYHVRLLRPTPTEGTVTPTACKTVRKRSLWLGLVPLLGMQPFALLPSYEIG